MNTATLQKTQRIHALDSLRAIMMLLGLVIHSVVTYGVIDYEEIWFLKDVGATSLLNDLIGFVIHLFRMQVFFFIAVFFGAMLFYERSPKRMVKNRIQRIMLPFVVFLLLLWPIIIFLIMRVAPAFSTGQMLYPLNSWTDFIPQKTFHLWFLYYLTLITLASVSLAFITLGKATKSTYYYN